MRYGPAASLLTLLACAAAAAASAAPPRSSDWPRVRVTLPGGAFCLREALEGASRRLAKPRCQGLFGEFRDGAGRPLRARLDELESSETSYLPLVVFADGSELPGCASPTVHAFTMQGSRVVFICVPRFERAWRRDRARAEAVLIHEAMHTLGLGENPPSSVEITKRVMAACSP